MKIFQFLFLNIVNKMIPKTESTPPNTCIHKGHNPSNIYANINIIKLLTDWIITDFEAGMNFRE